MVIKSFIGVCILGVMITSVFSGCVENGEIQTLKISGSTTVLPIAQRAAEEYMKQHPNVDIQVSGGGSSVGIRSVGEGSVDIGMASRELKSSEKTSYPNLVQHVIAKDGIAIIVNPNNPVSQLTIEQVKGIYNGTYTNWLELGGNDLEIVVVGRDSASGTREFFWEHIMEKEDFRNDMLEMNSNGAVHDKVATTPGAVGYVGLGYVDEEVKGLRIWNNDEWVEPTIMNVKNGKYPIARNLNMFTNGEPTGLTKDFIDFILSSEGQQIVEEEGFVSII
ncbi:MAG TPA: phosphate ABC transporter substrate-binding protein [Thermoplasmatales archaeon]|nr:phosphate ABC transporter substrate-binding protein [Thermoplasmatales archaeon]